MKNFSVKGYSPRVIRILATCRESYMFIFFFSLVLISFLSPCFVKTEIFSNRNLYAPSMTANET